MQIVKALFGVNLYFLRSLENIQCSKCVVSNYACIFVKVALSFEKGLRSDTGWNNFWAYVIGLMALDRAVNSSTSWSYTWK